MLRMKVLRKGPIVDVSSPTQHQTDFLFVLTTKPHGELKARLSSLTPQERVILDLIVRGQCNKEICKALCIEVTTAKAHISRIFKKLIVKNRVQAAVLGLWVYMLEIPAHREDDESDAIKNGDGLPRLATRVGRHGFGIPPS